MNTHSRARTTALSRADLVKRVRSQGWTVAAAADKAGISVRTAHKWLGRAKAEGPSGLLDRRSVPRRMPRITDADRTSVITVLRQCRASGPTIARLLRMPRSTVARVIKREGLVQSRPS